MSSHDSSKPFELIPESLDEGRVSASRAPTLRFHRVAPGETLTRIAEDCYGDQSFWVLLYGANEKLLRETNGLRPGLTLFVPFL